MDLAQISASTCSATRAFASRYEVRRLRFNTESQPIWFPCHTRNNHFGWGNRMAGNRHSTHGSRCMV